MAWLGGFSHDAVELRSGAGQEGPGGVVRVAPQHGAAARRSRLTPGSVPIELRVKARRIPHWTLNGRGLIGMLQPSPARSDEPLETVTLIPMGAARLRIAAFPTIGDGPGAHDWVEPSDFRVSASYYAEGNAIDAPTSTRAPTSSNPRDLPRFTWWPHGGTAEWLQYDFVPSRKVSAVEVYWFDDAPQGGCRVPASWRLLYKEGDAWKPVEGAFDLRYEARPVKPDDVSPSPDAGAADGGAIATAVFWRHSGMEAYRVTPPWAGRQIPVGTCCEKSSLAKIL